MKMIFNLILKQNKKKFITYELSPGIHSIRGFSEVVYLLGDHKGTLKNEYDDITKKTKLILTRFGSTFGTLRFDEKWFFNTLLGFLPFWDYKPTYAIHADSPGVYTSDKFLNLYTKNKIHLKGDVIDGSVVNGLRQPIILCSILDKPSGYKIVLRA